LISKTGDDTVTFTSMPLVPTLDFIERKIYGNLTNIPIPKGHFLNIIRISISNNFFKFEELYYKQKFGIAMGRPLSPVLAYLFMEYFESEVLTLPREHLRYSSDM